MTGSLVQPSLDRIPRRPDAFRIPRPLQEGEGLFVVDATWGTIRPMQLAAGVRTIGELEVIDHIRAGLPLVDSRLSRDFETGTLPGAVSIPHPRMRERIEELDPDRPTVMFCNGPQCAATPDAIEQLLAAGHPAESILYYRGGLHDWVTLGLPLIVPHGT